MSEYIPRDIHEQMWHPRNNVLTQLEEIFRVGATNDNVRFPCIERSGPVPLMAGVVDSPEDVCDRSNLAMYNIAARGSHAFRVDLFPPDEPQARPESFILSRQAGIGITPNAKPKPLPMVGDDYLGLAVILGNTVFSTKDAEQIEQKLAEQKRLVDINDYLSKYMWTRRQRMAQFVQNCLLRLDIYGFTTGISGPTE